MVCQLYRHYDDAGDLLYVGISISALKRLTQHKSRSDWSDQIRKIEIDVFPDRRSALVAEAREINRQKPKYNRFIPPLPSMSREELVRCIKRVRRGAWASSWDPNEDQWLNDTMLELCCELEQRLGDVADDIVPVRSSALSRAEIQRNYRKRKKDGSK